MHGGLVDLQQAEVGSDSEGKRSLENLLYLSRDLTIFLCSPTFYLPLLPPWQKLSAEKLPSELCLN